MTPKDHEKLRGVYVIGAGGHAKVVMDALQKNQIKVQGVFDLRPQSPGPQSLRPPSAEIAGVQLMPSLSWWQEEKRRAIIAIGRNQSRLEIAQKYPFVQWARAVHPSAMIHETSTVGEGTYIGAGVIIQPHVKIGSHCIINTGAIIEHDSLIHDYAHVGPRATLTGHAEVGEGALIGAGSTTVPQMKVGAWSVIGAGSVVVQQIPSNSKAFGVPCKVRLQSPPQSSPTERAAPDQKSSS